MPALRYGRQYFRPVSGDGVNFGISPFPGGIVSFSRILNNREVLVTANTNHFPSKQILVAAVYAPLMQPLLDHAREDLAQARPALETLRRHIRELVAIARQHRALTIPFLEAVTEAALHDDGRKVGDQDPRRIAPLTTPLTQLIAAGQQRGELRPFPKAEDMAAFITNAALLRVLTHPHESVKDTTSLLLALFLCSLEPA